MSSQRRRRSLSIFRPKLDIPAPASMPASPALSSSEYGDDEKGSQSPTGRPKMLPRSSRGSVFGSFRSPHASDQEEALIRVDSMASLGPDVDEDRAKGLYGTTVLHYGEVQTSGSMFRKRSQFLVLTESHLVRFKNQSKAAEMFPTIPASLGRNTTRYSSHNSVGSYHELQMTTTADITSGMALEQIVAAYRLDDGRPYFSIEVSQLDEEARRASSMHIQMSDPREVELWLNAIHAAANTRRAQLNAGFLPSTVEYVARVLERERDYDPEHFQCFTIVQRASNRSTGRSSSDDLGKLNSTICYLAIGINKVHIVPIPRHSHRSSTTSLADIEGSVSFGIVTLSSITAPAGEDVLQLTFKSPLRHPFAAHLASSMACDIALWLRHASEYLRPEWLRQPFFFNVPREMEDSMDPPNFPPEDNQSFDRTLIAYCAAYEVDTSRIRYTVEEACEDAPCFRLLAPSGHGYTALELLAVLRALRYNESFTSISMTRINLNPLRHLYDPYGTDTDSMHTRSGMPINLDGHQDLPILHQEIRALALKSRRLRRLDLAHTLEKPAHVDTEAQHCGIAEALVPLCKKSLTNVDWIILNGNPLAESDLDYLVDAASERNCHLRALEIGDCGLAVHDIDVLMSTMSTHEGTLEVIDISGVQGRVSPEVFQRQIGYFALIRKLNLTRVQKTTGPEPLIAPETLLTWRLESLLLSQTNMNEETVDSIAAYLASSRSDTLRELHVDQCGISGKDLAIFCQSMTRMPGHARPMHVSASENRLWNGYSVLFKTLAQSYGPSELTMRMIEFEKEHHFRELIQAITSNTTLRRLDISKASLPYDASDETCEALKTMLAKNQTLQELDISGEHAHLISTRFGIGLNLALKGLMENQTLQVLKIEHQSLGLQGASTLAEVLESNASLLEIHCDNNDINLQSFTVLVNALQKNTTLLYMPMLDHDREQSMDKVRREIAGMNTVDEPAIKPPTRADTIRRTLNNSLAGRTHHTMPLPKRSRTVGATTPYTDQDVMAAMAMLHEKWEAQITRMQSYLARNYRLRHGLPPPPDHDKPLPERPSTMESLSRMLDRITMDHTPTVERANAFEALGEKKNGRATFTAGDD